jgi:hypothetical protein
MIPAVVESHATEAVALLTDAFRNADNVAPILRAFTKVLQVREGWIWDVINKRLFANNPTGDQLDQLGAIVGEPRLGRADADYLPAVKLRIRANRSQGLAEDIIQITTLLLASFQYTEYGNSRWEIYSNVAVSTGAATLARILGRAKAAGSYGVVVTGTFDPDGLDLADRDVRWDSSHAPMYVATGLQPRGFTDVNSDAGETFNHQVPRSSQEAKR